MFSNGLHSADMTQDEAEIGYWIGKPYWGKVLFPKQLKHCFHDASMNLVLTLCGVVTTMATSNRNASLRNADSSTIIPITKPFHLLETSAPNTFIA